MIVFDVGDRASGKTTRLLEWLAEGKKIRAYPRWNRILVVDNVNMSLALRTPFHEIVGGTWPEVDYDHRVFTRADLHNFRGMSAEVEIAIDNIDLLLRQYFGNVKMVAATGLSVM